MRGAGHVLIVGASLLLGSGCDNDGDKRDPNPLDGGTDASGFVPPDASGGTAGTGGMGGSGGVSGAAGGGGVSGVAGAGGAGGAVGGSAGASGMAGSAGADAGVPMFTIGGQVFGLAGAGLVLRNGGGDDLSVGADGAFQFATALDDGAPYDVTVATQPSGPTQICTVSSGSGTVTAADVTDVVVICSAVVVPRYPTAGANWNDYVANDGPNRLAATGAPCPGTSRDGYLACVHAGELRELPLPGVNDCAGVAATDDLGAFEWVCDDSTGAVRMVSSRLLPGIWLSDLLDSSAPEWRPNRVFVERGGVPLAESPPSVWWQNPVVVSNDVDGDDVETLDVAGTIYVATADPTAAFTITADRVGLVVDPAVTSNGSPGSAAALVAASGRRFLWVEGSLQATGSDQGVAFTNTAFSVLRRVSVDDASFGLGPRAGVGVWLDQSFSNWLVAVTVSNGASPGMVLSNGSDQNTLIDIDLFNNTGGVLFESSSSNVVHRVLAGHSRRDAIAWASGSTNNVVALATVANTDGAPLDVAASSSGTAVLAATAVNNAARLRVQAEATFMGTAVVNTLGDGLRVEAPGTFANTAIAMASDDGIQVTVPGSFFTGLFKVGAGTVCSSAAGRGILSNCSPDGPSDFTLTLGAVLGSTFVGKVGTGGILDTTDDSANPDDDATPGTSPESAITEWALFENEFRSWGKDELAFPAFQNAGICEDPATCRIWDWSLNAADVGDPGGGPVLFEVLNVPTGDDTLVHAWTGVAADQSACDAQFPGSSFMGVDDCRTTFLRNAVEVVGDFIGNENGLCESGETCLYTPNIGSYQGHGGLMPLGAFTDGTLTGIRLVRFVQNGYAA